MSATDTCSYCLQKGHTVAHCPALKQWREEQSKFRCSLSVSDGRIFVSASEVPRSPEACPWDSFKPGRDVA